ncbi:MAG TPA: substrate-binding domain-containing protein [Bacteroidota bacterium]|nr:substrate-binding domain-containing protein [Bacteroidota bacterium]
MNSPRTACALVAAFLCTSMLSGCAKKPDHALPRKIAGIVFQEDQFFRLVLFGMRDAASRGGADLLEANSEGKPDKEIQLINTYIASGVDAIVISPLSAKASVIALGRAREKGITIITYNTNVEGDIASAYLESDQRALGSMSGAAAREYIEKHLGGKANVALLAFTSQAPEQSTMRTLGFREEVTKLPGVKIVAEQDAWLAEQAVRKAGDILTAHPDLDILWGANEGATVGEVMAVKNARRAGRVAVFGTDTGEQITGFLLSDDGILQAVTGQQPYEMGSRAVLSALEVLKGGRVEPKQSLTGVLLSRDDPEGVRKFAARLKELNR